MKPILFLSLTIFSFVKDVESHGNRQGNHSNTVCSAPYHSVGDYCLLIDNLMKGSWTLMRDVCTTLDGDLVNMADANILYDISNYLKDHGLDDTSYWVGASDGQTEGTWIWSSDDSPVQMGSPLWGRLYGLQPDGTDDQNCGAIQPAEFYYLHDDHCDSLYSVICQPRNTGEVKYPVLEQPNGNTGEVKYPVLEQPNECPPGYHLIGNGCFKYYVEHNYTWTDAAQLCSGPSSHLAKINDANLLGDLYDHLLQVTGATYFWIGGSDEELEDTWLWVNDGSPIKRGTPFWDVNREGDQEPDSGASRNCIYIHPSYLYRYSDGTCSALYGTICQYDTT